jgi:glycosyltransferase involved in cell wall biosynthesis
VALRIHGRLEEPMFADYIGALRAAAKDDARITFAGAYDAKAASQVFADMDALVVPSTWYENTPFVVLEAFAAGVPVIASDLGGLREVVREGHNGALFPAGDAQGLAAAIERVAARPQWFDADGFAAVPTNAAGYDRFRAAYAGS